MILACGTDKGKSARSGDGARPGWLESQAVFDALLTYGALLGCHLLRCALQLVWRTLGMAASLQREQIRAGAASFRNEGVRFYINAAVFDHERCHSQTPDSLSILDPPSAFKPGLGALSGCRMGARPSSR